MDDKLEQFGVLADGEALATALLSEGNARREVPGKRPWSCDCASPTVWRWKAMDTAGFIRTDLSMIRTSRRQRESALEVVRAMFYA